MNQRLKQVNRAVAQTVKCNPHPASAQVLYRAGYSQGEGRKLQSDFNVGPRGKRVIRHNKAPGDAYVAELAFPRSSGRNASNLSRAFAIEARTAAPFSDGHRLLRSIFVIHAQNNEAAGTKAGQS
jgi:hypothetical protein